MTRSDATLCSRNSPAPLAGNAGLYLSRSVSVKQSGWLQNLCTGGGTCVHCTITCPRHQPLWPATWSSASLTHGQAYHKTSQISRSMEKAVACKHEGKMTPLWTAAKLKPALFKDTILHNRLFSEPPTVYPGKHIVSRHLHRSCLTANKVSKSEGIRKVEYAYNFYRAMHMHKRGTCRHAVSVPLSVRLSRSWYAPKLIKISSKFFHHRVATPL